ncbi:hypothetical protein HDU83_005883 [Entophlyctis luteolus]|nr:hypothetical protein HDU83_005883 [Entophlyctis luteolus]
MIDGKSRGRREATEIMDFVWDQFKLKAMPNVHDTFALLDALHTPLQELVMQHPLTAEEVTQDAADAAFAIRVANAGPGEENGGAPVHLHLHVRLRSLPSTPPVALSVRSEPWMSRATHTAIQGVLDELVVHAAPKDGDHDSDVERDVAVCAAVDAMREFALPPEEWVAAAGDSALTPPSASGDLHIDDHEEELVRCWFVLVSLSTREKRNDLVKWAPRFGVTGFVMAGKPAVVCCEGSLARVDRYIAEIKAVSWADVPSHQKKISLAVTESIRFRKFGDMAEVTHLFDMGGHRGNRPDLGQVRKWMEERQVAHVFSKVFGLEALK